MRPRILSVFAAALLAAAAAVGVQLATAPAPAAAGTPADAYNWRNVEIAGGATSPGIVSTASNRT